jgi:hypothetical protein
LIRPGARLCTTATVAVTTKACRPLMR